MLQAQKLLQQIRNFPARCDRYRDIAGINPRHTFHGAQGKVTGINEAALSIVKFLQLLGEVLVIQQLSILAKAVGKPAVGRRHHVVGIDGCQCFMIGEIDIRLVMIGDVGHQGLDVGDAASVVECHGSCLLPIMPSVVLYNITNHEAKCKGTYNEKIFSIGRKNIAASRIKGNRENFECSSTTCAVYNRTSTLFYLLEGAT